ncbi:hypothetical protein AVEN_10384-1 [Araneus ventricosus]|uniref:Uncharacterized protein n=1 Tax=Araneus ventricosus TaxID=182803 RepID=A0A4Y2GX61_ARAVE|nr:hypothetical protein AVEN_10384-1 [Araneus ventricosus]
MCLLPAPLLHTQNKTEGEPLFALYSIERSHFSPLFITATITAISAGGRRSTLIGLLICPILPATFTHSSSFHGEKGHRCTGNLLTHRSVDSFRRRVSYRYQQMAVRSQRSFVASRGGELKSSRPSEREGEKTCCASHAVQVVGRGGFLSRTLALGGSATHLALFLTLTLRLPVRFMQWRQKIFKTTKSTPDYRG